MRINKFHISLIILLLSIGSAFSQETCTEIRVAFRVNSATIDRAYNNNAARLAEITSFFQQIEQDSTLNIVKVSFCGSASPEGSYQLNRRLARARLQALERVVRSEVAIPDSLITRDDTYISWELLREQILASNIEQKQPILDIIDQEPRLVDYPGGRHIDHRIVKLQALNNGQVWKHLKLYFERMRNAYVVFITYKREVVTPVETVETPQVVEEPQQPVAEVVVPQPEPEVIAVEESWKRHIYLKTNTVGWGLAISNIAAEIDLAKHWSFALPIYYTALNYCTTTIKFRTFTVEPELRYWFNENNQRFFIGAHLGFAHYNIAVDGDYRYQDHGGKSPSLGGGIGVGYRMPISKNQKWHLEFALGAGVYELHYDKHYNVENGKLIGTYRKTYWGIDNVAINISYRFNLNNCKK